MRTSSLVRGTPAILWSVLRWPIRLASVLVTAVLAYGWGDFATDPGPLEAIALIGLTVVLVASLQRLYRPGGMAAFEWDEEPTRRAPGEPVARREPDAAPRPEPIPEARPTAARGGSRSGGSLWSSERDREP